MCSDTPNCGSAGTAGSGSTQLREQLIVAEYNQCRDVLVKNIELMDKSEAFFFGSAGLSVAYFLANCNANKHNTTVDPTKILVGFFPLFILLFGLLRFFALDNTISIYNNYLETIEIKHQKELKLTRFFRKKIKRFYIITDSLHIFWRLLVIV